jgi:hypothetical protein
MGISALDRAAASAAFLMASHVELTRGEPASSSSLTGTTVID